MTEDELKQDGVEAEPVTEAEKPIVVEPPKPVEITYVTQKDFIAEQMSQLPAEVLCRMLGLADYSVLAFSDTATKIELRNGKFYRVVRPKVPFTFPMSDDEVE